MFGWTFPPQGAKTVAADDRQPLSDQGQQAGEVYRHTAAGSDGATEGESGEMRGEKVVPGLSIGKHTLYMLPNETRVCTPYSIHLEIQNASVFVGPM